MLSAGSAYVTVKPLFNKANWATAGKVAATGLVAVTAAAVGVVKAGGEYVDSLNKIQALTGATDAQLRRAAGTLEAQASGYAKMGMTVGDAASGVVELTKAGLSLDDALKAVNDTMVLAKAGEMSVADASSLVANTLNTFNLKASQAGDIANYLANAANISSADVRDLAESFKYVAPVAAATHVSLKQTNAILAELSNSGIAASNAGTGFRKFLLSLQAPSGVAAKDLKALGIEIFDASGRMKPLGTVIDILNTKLSGLTDERRQKVLKNVFGLTGISAAQVILKNGSKGLEEYTKGVGRAGAAQKLAESASRGFTGTLKSLRAEIISDAQAAYRKLSPSLDDAAKKVLAFVQQMKSGEGTGGDFVELLKDLASTGKAVLGVINGLPGPVKSAGFQILIASVAVSKLNSVLALPIARVRQFAAEMTYAETRAQRMSRASGTLSGGLRNLAGAGGMIALIKGANESNKSLGTLETTLGAAATGFAVGGPVGAAVGGLGGLVLSLGKNLNSTRKDVEVSIPSFKEYASTLDGVSASTTKATREMVYQRLQKAGLLTATRELGLSDRAAVKAMMGNTEQRKRLSNALRNQNTLTKEQEAALRKETGAVGASKLEQLKHNVAIAANRAELKKARKALHDFMAEPAAKRVSIIGVEDAKAQLNSLQTAIRQVFGAAKDLNTVGPGGIDVLLNPKARATGGPVAANRLYLVGEHGPELFVPSETGRIMPNKQTMAAISRPAYRDPAPGELVRRATDTYALSAAPQPSLAGTRLRLVVGDREFDAYVDERADSRVDSAAAMVGEADRAL